MAYKRDQINNSHILQYQKLHGSFQTISFLRLCLQLMVIRVMTRIRSFTFTALAVALIALASACNSNSNPAPTTVGPNDVARVGSHLITVKQLNEEITVRIA